MTRFDAARVRRYYDRHTRAFVGLGEGGTFGAIHRAVWGPGVREPRAAFHFVDDWIADVLAQFIPAGEQPHVVDLGCGVGASLRYLAGRLPLRGIGITLSPVQAALGSRQMHEAGLSDRLRCIEGDICDVPRDLGPADAAYAIESFVHVPSAARFFAECRRLIRPGGVLVICDDFRVRDSYSDQRESSAARTCIDRFCRGWHVNSLLDARELRAAAAAAGFEHVSTLDLTPYLELGRARDRLLHVLLWPLRWLPADRVPYGYLLGGDALQTCLRRGWIVYQLVLFRRTADPP